MNNLLVFNKIEQFLKWYSQQFILATMDVLYCTGVTNQNQITKQTLN